MAHPDGRWSHHRVMGGPQAIRMVSNCPAGCSIPKPSGVSRGLPSSSSGSGPAKPVSKEPLGHAADRNKCTLQCPEKKVHHPANRSAREAERGEAESVSN
jgi:hypothetical protein